MSEKDPATRGSSASRCNPILTIPIDINELRPNSISGNIQDILTVLKKSYLQYKQNVNRKSGI